MRATSAHRHFPAAPRPFNPPWGCSTWLSWGRTGTCAASSAMRVGLMTKADSAKTATEATDTKTGLRQPFVRRRSRHSNGTIASRPSIPKSRVPPSPATRAVPASGPTACSMCGAAPVSAAHQHAAVVQWSLMTSAPRRTSPRRGLCPSVATAQRSARACASVIPAPRTVSVAEGPLSVVLDISRGPDRCCVGLHLPA